jgi:2-polyprenyl-3-methyl-5-hydroxy-6-metoxy-1,4-benzoquinol methylase
MKILVAIANYGTGNDKYLSRVLDEFRTMEHNVDLVVTTNISKSLGPDVEVVVGLPSKNPRSLPFAHKKAFAERLESYDLFVYTEDDILIRQRNVSALLRANEVLADNELAGFFRSETDSQGKMYFPDVHYHYHWDSASVTRRGEYAFARFTNLHSGCYALTKQQLRQAIKSGGFLVQPHEGAYEPLETAATDPYTQCGFRKMICISHIDDFIVPHLSNRYAGKGSLAADDFHGQLRTLSSLSQNGKSKSTLFPVETHVLHQRWSKSYYEPCQDELIALIPKGAQSVLSIGSGWGATEKRLIENGLKVKAVPIDSVIAASAEARGVETVCGDMTSVREQLTNERFDCLLISNVLHLVRDPAEFLASLVPLSRDGCMVVSTPNLSELRLFARGIRFRGLVPNPKSYEAHGMHVTTGRIVRRWLRKAGLRPMRTVWGVSAENESADRRSLGLAKPMFAESIYILAATNPSFPN